MAMADVEIGTLAHEAYVFKKIDSILEMLELSDRIFKSLPMTVRKGIEEGGVTEEEIQQRIAFVFAQFNPEVRNSMQDFLYDVKQVITCLVDGEEISHTYGREEALNENDKTLIASMVTFAQSVGPKSVRQLLNFLEATNNDEWGYMLIKSKGRDSEVRHRYSLSPVVEEFFDL